MDAWYGAGVIFSFISFIKDTMRPSSPSVLLVLVTLLLAASRVPRCGRWAKRLLAGMLLGYWVLACPLTVRWLAAMTTGGYRPVTAVDVAGAEAVVVLGGGSLNIYDDERQLAVTTLGTGLRVLEGARVFHLAGAPVVVVSGGVTDRHKDLAPESEAMGRALRDLGVPADRIIYESASKTTHEQAMLMGGVLRSQSASRFVLVTSPLHMRRAERVFKKQGLHPVPAVAHLGMDDATGVRALLPSDAALLVGEAVVYEWAALAYYWGHGWL